MSFYQMDKVLVLGLMIVLALAIGCSGVVTQPMEVQDQAGSPPFSKADSLELSKGTPIYVRLQQPISSLTAEAGQSFSAVLDEPLMINGRVAAPEGSSISGRVVAARQSGRLRNTGYLRLTLSSLTLNGKELPIHTSSVFVEGGSFKNHSMAYIGGGAGIGSFIGASGGAAAYAAGKNEVGFAAERRIGFRLIESLDLPDSSQ